MSKIKITIFLILISTFVQFSYSDTIEIKVKINDQIITNLDIEIEKKYLLFLNPKLIELERSRVEDLARNSLITEIIKKIELEKFFDFTKNNHLVNKIEKQLIKRRNISNVEDFKKILKSKDLNYFIVKEKLLIETLWNKLIYDKYKDNVVINKEELRENIIIEFNNNKKKFAYNLSEIVLSKDVSEAFDERLLKIDKSIEKVGFENTANIYSISSSSKNGGLIGWVNEIQISKKINEKIRKLEVNQITEPIEIQNGYILIKVNNKKQIQQDINIDNELDKLISKEMNRQLSNFSTIFYKKLKKNIEINEY
ncbi:peptidylprolyl isomerase [Pelagibacterales bacterium SAG-MED34]|nr:peptidylprolyl isomerase [Pelagibacterales bacterium SAG-MED34]